MKLHNIIKYLSIIIAVLATFFLLFHKQTRETSNSQQNSDKITVTSTGNRFSVSDYEINGYNVIVKKISSPDAIIIPNFENTKTSEDIFESYSCSTLINGGLYTKNRTPLGLFSLEGKQYSKINIKSENTGLLIINSDKSWAIIKPENYNPIDYHYFIMQSGPLFVYESKFNDIPNNNEIKGRRIVITIDKNDQLFLVVLYDDNNLNSGPKISELKQILEYINENNLINLKTALNLDGGDSSIFIDNNYSLRESAFPGTYICFK